MKTFLALLLPGTLFSLAAADIVEVRGTRTVSQVPAFSEYGRVQLLAAEALVSVPKTAHVPADMHLLVVFDPATGHFLSVTHNLSPKDPATVSLIGAILGTKSDAIYSAQDSITLWQAASMPATVLTSPSSAPDLSTAFERALSELKAGWDRYYSQGKLPNLQKVDLLQLDEAGRRSFLDRPDMSAQASSPPVFDDIVLIEGGYKIRMHANWEGEVVVAADLTIQERFHRVTEK